MLGPNDRLNAVIDVVIGQDRAQKLLLGFDRMGHGLRRFYIGAGGIEGRDLVHGGAPRLSQLVVIHQGLPVQIVCFCG